MMVEMQAKKTGRQILATVLAGVMLSAAPAYAAQSQTTEKAGSAVSGTVQLQAEKEQTEGSRKMSGETEGEFSEPEAESEIEATVDLDALKEAKDENGLKADDWLPIGSVVLLNGANKSLMVISRFVYNVDDGTYYEYCGCLYPEGISDSEYYFFNHNEIGLVVQRGFEDEYEKLYRKTVLDGINVSLLNQKTETEPGTES
ncbi:MAG: DUF4176 domain-containing protein [Porcincola intestinalis]|uniref:DUF4176 domain-containing protein n=1 Tax=Porcincola intestinalis TaxID=2606632 RepID=UPI0029DA677B|nr:DUF4176 domain-containing protein [Porcincola intestinalis]MCI6239174.1 DUF4176 domain-containing protein [Lachnospiraceae bacterium]MDY5332112.1 DUF4176 domain-containing protein [Porcincola intestinalis]